MLPELPFNGFLLIPFFVLCFATIIHIFVMPYIRIQAYKSPEAEVHFYPMVGFAKWILVDFKMRGDVKASSRDFTKDHPNKKYVVTNLSVTPCISLRDPQYIKELTLKPYLYKKHSITDGIKLVIGNGLILSDGEEWKRKRKMISSLLNYDLLKENINVIHETTTEFFNNIKEEDLEDYQMQEKFQQITGEVVGQIFFSEKLSKYNINGKPLANELSEIISTMGFYSVSPLLVYFNSSIFNLPFIPPFRNLMNRIKRYRAVCHKIIQERRAQKEYKNDLLGLLLITQQNEDPDLRFTDDDIVNEFTTFFSAGTDTTAYTSMMLLYFLQKNPQYIKEIEDERTRMYNTQPVKTIEMLQKMDVIHSAIKETLRINPPLPSLVFREVLQDHKIGNLHLKKGHVVECDLLASSMNESIFPNPYEFNPTRWRNPDVKIDPYAFIPFSTGPRNCIGQQLAYLEVKIIVSEFLDRFDFKLKDNYNLKLTLRIIYEPYEKMHFKLTRKSTLIP